MKRKTSLDLRRPLNNENGSVIIAAIFILVLVTILGVAATNTTTLELQIAANDQFMKMAFYNSDASLYGTAKLISTAINVEDSVNSGSGTDAPGLTYLTSASDFYRQIAGYAVYDNLIDINFNAGGIDAQTDARRDHTAQIEGGGAEFATGSESAGTTAIGIYYVISATGFSNRQTASDLTANYRKMIRVPGGL